MMLKYSNLLEPPYQKKLVKSIKIKLNYIGLMVCQSSERKVVFSLKKLQRLFKECNFEIIAESNKKIVNDLDVTLNLKPGSFRPYHKPDGQMQYIHTESNYMPNIIKQIPVSIENCLSNLSREIFKESTTLYEDKLQQCGYSKKLTYTPTDTNQEKQ